MRQLVIAAMLLVLAGEATAQDRTPAPGARGSYFGAPVLRSTVMRGQAALMFGGKGGLNLTPSLTIGASLMGTMSEVDAPEGAVPAAPGPLDLKFESFGLDLEYGVRPAAPTHLTLATFMGGGAAHYVKNGTAEQDGETDFMLVLEPAVGVDQRVTDWLHLNLAGSYRLVRGVEQPGLTPGDLRGPAVSLALKLGRF